MKQLFLLLALGCIIMQVSAQFQLGGTITDMNNEPLPNAYVFIEDTYYKTVSGNDGSFIFRGINKGVHSILVSYIGYENQQITMEIDRDTLINVVLHEDAIVGEEIVVEAVRASESTPTTFTLISRDEIVRRNTVQDLPYILSEEPSLITTSDAGTGVGYTSLRIRGSDITRINVTINGVPLNDPESHAVYWVDIPDIAGSINSIQVQRGVGTSTNGAGAFGASMNMETNVIHRQAFGEINLSAGSFNTWKTSFNAGTGLINDHYYLEGRASAIGSDGYVDRAFSKLNSYFLQGGYYGNKTTVKAIMFGGNEKTYQAWYGVDEYTLKTDRTFNWAGAVFGDNGRISFYDNQTDNYRQDHYQLHVSHQPSPVLNVNIAAHYTYGRGYYEEYVQDVDLQTYGMDALYFGLDSIQENGSYIYFYHDTINNTDLIQRRWLDNHFYGITWSLKKKGEHSEFLFGGAYNKYDRARHFGEIIWAEFASQREIRDTYYNNTAFKSDFNVFLKVAFSPADNLSLYGDLQYRYISYRTSGIDDDLAVIDVDESHHFVNPKIGLAYESPIGIAYASFSIAHREPIRDDYLDAESREKPEAETLRNMELGIRRNESTFSYAVNYYLMNYLNQLVLTGEINEDGAYVRKNTGKSYRTGLELTGEYRFGNFLSVSGNMSFNRSRTNYNRFNSEGELEKFDNVDISFSPWFVGGTRLNLFPYRNLEITWFSKYVSEQYLDNTGNKDLRLKGYLVSDIRLGYILSLRNTGNIELSLLINNIFNKLFESNGYVWGETPYFYPQAGTNILAGISFKI